MDNFNAIGDSIFTLGVHDTGCESSMGLCDRQHAMVFPNGDDLGGGNASPPRPRTSIRCRAALEWILKSLDPDKAEQWANRLIDEFGNLPNTLMSANDPEAIAIILDDDPAPALHIKEFSSVIAYIAQFRFHQQSVYKNWDQTIDYLTMEMGWLPFEQMRALFIDSGHFLLGEKVFANGINNEVQCYSKHVARHAVMMNASGVLLVHNHPSGNPQMGHSDKSMTYEVDEACRAVGVRLHDHLVICRDSYYSFRLENPLWAQI